MSGSKIVVIVTGSIAAYKACEVVSDLVQRGHAVRVVATESALRFVGATTFEGLTGQTVLSDLFAAGAALEHINLTRWADGVLVCPATANTINRFAAGLAGDLPGALFLAHDWTKPFLIAPAMNPLMWRHPATVAAVERLGGWGARFLPVGNGHTACGEMGEGRMADPAAIVAQVEAALARPARRLRVLVTGGGTAEPIDGVRTLGNSSTGGTGAEIADRFFRGGHEVVLLRARSAAVPAAPCREELFGSFAELDAALARLLGAESFDLIIHAAAVSDFGVGEVVVDGAVQPSGLAKLSGKTPPVLRLRAQPKLVDGLRARSLNQSVRVIAFKLTSGASAAAAQKAVRDLISHARPDYIVHNDLAARGARPEDFPADIFDAAGAVVAHCGTRPELAAALERLAAGRPHA